MTTIRTWLDVLLIRCLSRDAKAGIEDFLETDLSDRSDFYRERVFDDVNARNGLRAISHLAQVYVRAVRPFAY